MRITKRQLRRIIREEYTKALDEKKMHEGFFGDVMSKLFGKSDGDADPDYQGPDLSQARKDLIQSVAQFTFAWGEDAGMELPMDQKALDAAGSAAVDEVKQIISQMRASKEGFVELPD